MWYHFAIMFEAVFILTTLDAGTRVGRFMLQDILGNYYKPLGNHSSLVSNIITSSAVVFCWGYFLYIGVIDPNGGVNILWPLFGIANQMLAAIALCVVTAMLIKYRNKLYAMVSAIPLCWLLIITTVAAYEKIFSEDSRVGFLAAARNIQDQISNPTSLIDIDVMQKIAFNLHLNIVIISILVIILWIVVIDVVKLLFQVKVYEKNI
jgi:carbon starvation protein